jgi:VWFA-related protein
MHISMSILRNVCLLAYTGVAFAQTAPSNPLSSSSASPPPDSSTGVPEFRVHSDVVLVPVAVLDKHGEHISGLTKVAFRLEENGKEQTIASVEEMHRDANSSTSPSSAEDGYSNLPFDITPHLTIVVLDFLNSSLLQRTDAREQITKFLSKDLRGNEPISLLCITPKGVRLLRSFTSDRSLLIQSLQDVNVGLPFLGRYQDAVRFTLDQIGQIARAYAGVPGRKSLIWVPGDLPYPVLDMRVGGPDLEMKDEFDAARKSLLSANIAVYEFSLLASSLGPRINKYFVANNMPNAQPFTANNMADARYFADSTGGNVCAESNDFANCLNQAVEDSRSYYMLSYSVKPDDRKPGWRNLKVKVPGVQASVRARSGFFYQDPALPIPPDTNHKEEIAALASPLSASAVRMNVRVLPPAATPTTLVPPGAKTTVQFLITIPLSAVNMDPSRSSAVDLEIGAIALD